MYDTLGRAAIRFALVYVRRRYRRELLLGAAGIGLATLLAAAAYLLGRDVPEG